MMTASNSSLFKILSALLLVLLLVALGLWQWSERKAEQNLAAAEEQAAARLASVESNAGVTLRRLAQSSSESLARAFTAGIEPAVLSADRSAVDSSIGQLLLVAEVDFVHVLSASGEVFASSDRKLMETGNAGALGDWARSVDRFTSRAGTTEGVTQVAVPIVGAGERVATVIVGCRTDSILQLDASSPQTPAAADSADERADPSASRQPGDV